MIKNPFNKQSQFELFPGAPGIEPRKEKSPIFGQPLKLSFENIIVFGIAFIMGMVVSFSFGVEKGKRIQAQHMQKQVPKKIVAPQVFENKKEAPLPQQQVAQQLETVEMPEKYSKVEENQTDFEKSVDKKPSLEKIHTIQVASFKQIERAERETRDLKQLGHDAFVAQKGSYYIVCVGQFETPDQGRQLLRVLKKKYHDCYIRSL